MKNMPPLAGKDAVVHFFRGFQLSRLVIILDRSSGKSLGEALVELASSEQCSEAQKKCNDTIMGSKQVTLELAELQHIDTLGKIHGVVNLSSGGDARRHDRPTQRSERVQSRSRTPPRRSERPPRGQDWHVAKDRHTQEESSVLMMKGLPFDATTSDIEGFFKGYKIRDLIPVVPLPGRPNKGEAYVELGSARECASAIEARNKAHIGDRYIDLYPATHAGLLAEKRNQR